MTGFKSKEEAIKYLQDKKRLNKEKIYDDWYYQTFMIDACDIYADEFLCTMPAKSAKYVQAEIEKDRTKMYHFGNIVIRGYMIKRFVFCKAKFVSLGDWAKQVCLKENPNLFAKYEENFSPKLKEYIDEMKKAVKGKENGQK